MIRDELKRLAQQRISITIKSVCDDFNTDVAFIRAEMASRGVLASGMTVVRITSACIDAVSKAKDGAWQELKSVLDHAEVDFYPDLASDIKGVLKSISPNLASELNARVAREAQVVSGKSAARDFSSVRNRIDTAIRTADHKVGLDVDLYVLGLNNSASPGPGTNEPIINIYGTVGIVQTGNQASADISVGLDGSSSGELIQSLEMLSTKLAAMSELPAHSITEITEIVDDGINELKREEPNQTKLRSMMATIGSAIHGVGQLKPAYDSMKMLGKLIGVDLP